MDNTISIQSHSVKGVCAFTAQSLPVWLNRFPVVRFDNAEKRYTAKKANLADFVRSLMTAPKAGIEKANLPAWALCNDTGTDEGTPNGLLQLDFDDVTEPEGVKAALADYDGGVLLAAVSASGKGVFGLIYAPDHEGGEYAALQIADYVRSRGYAFGKLDKSCFKACQLRYESYDPAPYIAPECAAIAPNYADALTRSGAREAFEIWTNGRSIHGDDYEAAVTAIFAASIVTRPWVQYLDNKKFRGGCDVQIIAKSGDAKTYGRVHPLRELAKDYGIRFIGGLRTTDAAMYDAFIHAACNVTYDLKNKVTGVTVREEPDKLACILDESGDTEKSRQGNTHKAQANVIRRTACFDGEIDIGSTAEQGKNYNGLLPEILPVRMVQYRCTTANQLNSVDFDDQQQGGNARRTLYAEAPERPHFYLASEDRRAKNERLLSAASEERLTVLSEALYRVCGQDLVTFCASSTACDTARQAAKLAFERARIPENYADTIIYNTALFVGALRCAVERMHTQHDAFDNAPFEPFRELTENDIETATAIALNSFAVVRRLTATSAAERLATARTDTEKTRCIVEYIAGRKRGEIARGNLARHFGRDVLSIVEGLCVEGVLTETVKLNADHKNPNYFFSVTPEGQQENAAKAYALRHAARAPKTKPRDDASVWNGNTKEAKSYADANDADKESRVLKYVATFERDNAIVQGNRNSALNKLVCELQNAGMWDGIAQTIVQARAENAGLDAKEIKVLMRPRRPRA